MRGEKSGPNGVNYLYYIETDNVAHYDVIFTMPAVNVPFM